MLLVGSVVGSLFECEVKGMDSMMDRVVHVSSNANNAAIAGVFCVNANNDSSNANRNIGSQLAGRCNWNPTPARKGEYVYPIQSGSNRERLGEHQR